MSITGSQKLALRQAFESGRRNGFWLAKNEPWKKESKDKSARLRDVFARKKQDDAMEGVSSMFDEPPQISDRQRKREMMLAQVAKAKEKAEETVRRDLAVIKRKNAIRASLMRTERGRALLKERGIIE